ncbi:hypothetical protein OWR29_34310 [Actinoplanes sp. Pm04-4]|uniref:Uncharacterized protein n=1 Tax=Paractinoplanes pyxinae TaxID=2997416 RepID=A0ABT4BAR3_9ACTN|nr:hypothetical protein [Actinoplanes pyxinae]MCY1143097.1 hypothetical protein [Actinoplanes pyxinae]
MERLEVDGEVFEVEAQPGRSGVHDYKWVSGRDPDYGFTSARSDGSTPTTAEHVEAVRDFLAEIDPDTGYMRD